LLHVDYTLVVPNDPPVANDQGVATDEDTAVNITLTGSDPDNDPLTFSVTGGPGNGTLNGSAPDLTYTPFGNFNGVDSFSFTVNDSTVDSPEATVSITVDPVNDQPSAEGQSVDTNEDTAVAITLTGSDVDTGDTLSFAVASGPSNGSLSGTPPNLTYTPFDDFNGADSFTFTANDGQTDSASATVDITIDAVNDAPAADGQSVGTDEDTAVAITLSGSDIDAGDTLSFVVASGPSKGSLSGTPPNLTYTPFDDFNGSDSFTFTANDGQTDSASATVDIIIDAVNDAPAADGQSVGTDEDTAVSITLSGSDIDIDDTLSFAVAAGPSNGSLSGTPPNLTYTPFDDFNGSDSFTFTANDGQTDSASATVDITIDAVNDPPAADGQSVGTYEDTGVSITLSGSDIDTGDTLSFAVASGPSNGSLSGTPPNLTYTPFDDFNGPDSFTFTANDGQKDSASATVDISVDPVNDTPTADDQSVSTEENSSLSITLTGADVDGDSLTFDVVNTPSSGTMSGTAPDLSYTPFAGYNGPDSFTFTTNDGTEISLPATVNITVTPVNDPPTADDQGVSTEEDTLLAINLTGSDPDGDQVSFNVDSGPSHGSLSGTLPNLIYTPLEDYNGPDSFTFIANDGLIDSEAATVGITVNPVNDAPEADDQTLATDEDVPVSITLTGSDVDGDSISFTIADGPSHGSLSGVLPNLTYTPASDYNGPDSFTFTTNDSHTDSTAATVSITVSEINDAPIAIAQSVSTGEDSPAVFTLTGSDIDGDSLIFSIGSAPDHGSLSGSAPNMTYSPDADYHGADSFTFKANDGLLDSTLATINITVSPVNDAPAGNDQSVSTEENTSLGISLSGSDVDGDSLTYVVVNNPTDGSLSGTAPNILYSPDAGYNGPDSITFKVNDGAEDSPLATVTINVTPINDPPTADDQGTSTEEDSSVAITLTGSDPDGDSISFSVAAGPSHGSLTGSPPNVTYTPGGNYNGSDSFTFKVNDGTVDSAVATVNIMVNPVNDAPTADSQAAETDEDEAVSISLRGSDVEGDDLAYTVVSSPSHGSLSGSAPNLTYAPNTDYNGSDSFTFTVNDGAVDSGIATVDITINPVNDAPSADDLSIVTDEDTPVTISLTGSDVDGDPLSFTVADEPSNGALSGNPPNLTYTPFGNFSGSDSFTFVADDGAISSPAALINITINAINDSPAVEAGADLEVTLPDSASLDSLPPSLQPGAR